MKPGFSCRLVLASTWYYCLRKKMPWTLSSPPCWYSYPKISRPPIRRFFAFVIICFSVSLPQMLSEHSWHFYFIFISWYTTISHSYEPSGCFCLDLRGLTECYGLLGWFPCSPWIEPVGRATSSVGVGKSVNVSVANVTKLVSNWWLRMYGGKGRASRIVFVYCWLYQLGAVPTS